MSLSIRQAIANGVYNRELYHFPIGRDISWAEFRRGLAEIDVGFLASDGSIEHATIDSAPVMSILLQKLIDEEAVESARAAAEWEAS